MSWFAGVAAKALAARARQGETLDDLALYDLAGLMGRQRVQPGSALPPPEKPLGARPQPMGVGKDPAAAKGSTPGGIASPLTEGIAGSPDTYQRTLHATARTLVSADGFLSWTYYPPRQVSLLDATGAPVQVLLALPPA